MIIFCFLFTILVHFQLLAIVDFHPSGLPEGWVRELVFRKTKEGLIRRDPVNNKVHSFDHWIKGHSLF